jgi:UDPglucose--hexose-1-phosphate uridylyltransferase
MGRWVIVASERAKRPADFKNPPVALKSEGGAGCPFCEGQEAVTPPEIFAIRAPTSKRNERGWKVRVVPNKFPALRIEGNLDKRGAGLYDRMNGIGAHEVIIETPQHLLSMTSLDEDHIKNILTVYKERMLDLKKDTRLVYGLIFKNVGDPAGASLEHTHSQLIATPVVPVRVQQEMRGGRIFYDYRSRCLFCDIIAQELEDADRIVADNNADFIAFCPYASRFPFETWILPKQHLTHFENITPELIDSLARMLKNVLTRGEKALNSPPYNFLIHSTPFNERQIETYHWHIEIIPRITRVAGFEWGTGFYINPVPPEDAAKYLREIQI